MIDIHSHILRGLDDGPESLDESVAMLRIAAEAGTTDIVATPHSNLDYSFDPEQISERIAELSEAVGPAPRIHCGCDFLLSYDNIQDALADPTRYTINHRNYLLVEFSDLLIFKNAMEIFGRLLDAGMVPVVTHPERNWLLQQRTGELEKWVAEGCLLQVTAQSLLGRFGKRARRFAETLMRRGLVHFVASDAHDPEDRTPDLSGAYEHVASKYSPEWAERLFVTNPRHVLTGEDLDLGAVGLPPQPRKWYRFWDKP